MNQKQELVFTELQEYLILEASHIHFCKTGMYRYASIATRINILTAYVATAKLLLKQHHEVIPLVQTDLNEKKYLVNFLKAVKNDIYFKNNMVLIDRMHESLSMFDKTILESEIYKIYSYVSSSKIVSKFEEAANIQAIPYSEVIHKENAFKIIQDIDVGIKCRSAKAFYSKPSVYIHSSKIVTESAEPSEMEHRIKMLVIQSHLAEAFLGNDKKRMREYIDSINIYNETEHKEKLLTHLHGGSLTRKAVYIHRMHEIENMLREFNNAERHAFDTVLDTVLASIDHCKKNRITSFLAITNVIMNNLLVAAFENSNIRKVKEKELASVVKYTGTKGEIDKKILDLVVDIKNHIKAYYENVHERLCAYSINTAIKQALGTMYRYEPDLFKPSVKKDEAN